MKPAFIFVIVLVGVCLAGCTSSKNMANPEEMHVYGTVTKATYQNWSGQSPVPFGGLERGTDLVLHIEEWPEEQTADYVVFRRKKSFPARIVERSNDRVEIHARIMHESRILMEVSESVDLSDRLVFTRPDGETGFVEIVEWEWIE